jgi:hypothetical protein
LLVSVFTDFIGTDNSAFIINGSPMSNLITAAVRICLALMLIGLTSFVNAAEEASHVAAMRYVSLDTQGDNASRQYSGTGSFTLGNYMWLQGTIGQITADNNHSLGDVQQFGVGTGFSNGVVRLGVNYDRYKDDDRYQQRNLLTTLDWTGERISIGLDIARRSTDNSIDTTLGQTNISVRVDEKLIGNGIGLHADFTLTDALSMSLGGMSYNYDSNYELTASTNLPLLQRLLTRYPTIAELVYLNNSGVTRSLALLDNTYNFGLSYQFNTVALSAQFLRDEGLESDVVTNTGLLSAAVFIGDHWLLSPAIGQSRSSDADSIGFGGLSLSYNW